MKTYILRTDNPRSIEYALTAAQSCENVGMKWEYFEGTQSKDGTPHDRVHHCSHGHYAIWKKIAEGEDESGIVFEHDAIMLHPIGMKIPDGYIVVLGYKVREPETYDHISAGPPKELIDIVGHHGAHAYAMTKKTAQMLLDEQNGNPPSDVDGTYFIRGTRRTSIPLKIMSPTPALAWIRKSTIWDESVFINYELIPSFKDNYIKIDTDEQVATKWLPIEFHLRRKRLRIFFDTEENKNLVLKDITEFVKNEDELTIKGTCIVHGEITTMRVTFPKANYGPNKTLGENLLVRVMDNPDMDIKISAKTFDYDFSEYLNDK